MPAYITTLDSKMTLPMSFRHKYHNVSVEIEVQKPSKAVNQALRWFDYKKGHKNYFR